MIAASVIACNGKNPPSETPSITQPATPQVTPTAVPTPEITATPVPQIDLEDVPEYTFTEALRVNIGKGDGEVGYEIAVNEAGNSFIMPESGPQDFLIREDGSICILDSTNYRILIFKDGDCVGTVSILGDFGVVFGQIFDYWNGKFYVLDHTHDTINIVSDPAITGNNSFEAIPLPKEEGVVATDVHSLDVTADGVRIYVYQATDYWTERYDYIMLHDEKEFSIKMPPRVSYHEEVAMPGVDAVVIKIDSEEWSLVKSSYETSAPLGADNNGNLYLSVHEFETNTQILSSKRTIRAFDRNGSIFGYAHIDFYDWVTSPLESVKVTEDGTIYVMNCFEDYVSIQKVNFN